ncbi:MAG: TRAP-type C4-dicarboxylate transport system permease small subunit [Bradymonadia bacterium]|jgi:TRAP-type C4-dicarboxylate transport system permease small subunit
MTDRPGQGQDPGALPQAAPQEPALEAVESPAPRGRLQLVDDGIYRIERTFVTLAALLMTTTVTLDIIYRSFASGESQLATKLQTMLGWFGQTKTQAQYEFLRDWVTPACLIGLTFIAGWAIFGAIRRRREQPPSVRLGALVGLASVAGACAFVQFVVKVPSVWVCISLLLLGCAVYVVHAAREQDWGGVALTVIIAALGSWGGTTLPEQYIWSQELSLILLAWMAFLGGSMATRAERHITVDALSRLIPKSIRPYSRALGLLVTAIFCMYMTYLSYEHVFGPAGDYVIGERRPSTQIPAWLIILSVIVAFVLMSARFLARSISAFLNPVLPDRELTH